MVEVGTPLRQSGGAGPEQTPEGRLGAVGSVPKTPSSRHRVGSCIAPATSST